MMLTTINCDQKGLDFVKETEFRFVPSGSTYLHLFSCGLKNRCDFKALNLTINKKQIENDYLHICNDKDEYTTMFIEMVEYLEHDVLVTLSLEQQGDQIDLLYRQKDNIISLKLNSTIKEQLLGLPYDEFIMSFLWKYNISQKIEYCSKIKTESTTSIELYLYECIKVIELTKNNDSSDNSDNKVNDDFKIEIKI